MRFRIFLAVGLLTIGCAAAGWSQSPAKRQASIGAGREMAQTYCSACHAIGKTGKSTHPDAPAFRTLSERYPIDSLAEAFAEGISVGHRDMPEWQFEPPQIDNLLAYLKSVQVPRPKASAPSAAAVAAARAREVAKSAAEGAAFAQTHCASCHAVGADRAASPNPNAPTFGAIANLPGFTSTAFSAWLLSSHASMPLIKVEPADRARLFDYLQTLNRKANSL